MNIWFRLLDASIPFMGGIFMLLLWLKVIPLKKDFKENKIFYAKYSKFIIVLSILLLVFSLTRLLSI